MTPQRSLFFLSPLHSGLQSRIVVPPFAGRRRSWQIIHLDSGALEATEFAADQVAQQIKLTAPALLCHPVSDAHQIRLLAGSSGVQLAADAKGIDAALGATPEAAEIRALLRAPLALPLAQAPERAAQIGHALRVAAIELAGDTPQPGQAMLIEAQLRSLLVYLWRDVAGPLPLSQGGGPGPQEIVLHRFRQLVETQYRARWRVTDYADALGVTPDRLHHITTLRLGKPPLSLIHARCQSEARALLARSNMTLDQIAEDLGFSSSAQFSAFFKKQEGRPPGQYRAHMRRTNAQNADLPTPSLTSWP